MAGVYKELRSDWNINVGETSIEGSRAFVEVDSGTQSQGCIFTDLPSLNDPFSVDYPGCKCNRIEQVPYAVLSGGTNGYKTVCGYTTEPNTVYPLDAEYATTFTGGAKMEAISNPSSWYWLPYLETEVTDQIDNQNVYRMNVSGTFSQLKYKNDADSEFSNYVSTLMTAMGKINLTLYSYFSSGQLLFTSFDSKPLNNGTGDKIWAITLNFSYMILSISNSSGVVTDIENPWQYILNDKAAEDSYKYERPVKRSDLTGFSDKDNGLFLYDYFDFNSL